MGDFMDYQLASLPRFERWLAESNRETLILGIAGFENLVYAIEQELVRRADEGNME